MVCIVAGFPSNIAALQFEWAWHNAHLTKHISAEARISQPTNRTKTNNKTGKKRKRPGRPRTSLIDKLSNMHLLLRAPYFSQWPLQIRFFSLTVYKTWVAYTDRVDEQLRPHIHVVLDLPQDAEDSKEIPPSSQVAKKSKADLIGKGGVSGVDPTYARFQPVFQKLRNRLEDNASKPRCDVCHEKIDVEKSLFNICLDGSCQSLSHVTCLSDHFLKQSPSDMMLPVSGSCPSCKSTLQWSDLMRVLSLCMRGAKFVDKLLKKKRKGAAAIAAEMLEEDDETDDDMEDRGGAEEEGESELDDDASVTSVEFLQPLTKSAAPRSAAAQWIAEMLEVVIEDSEDER